MPIWIYSAFIFAFGCCIGSFLNVVIYRLPRGKSLVRPPSACTACGRDIAFYDNIPLVSWLVLGARCRYCKAPISPRYFIVEFITALFFTAIFILYFYTDIRTTVPAFLDGGWLIYLVTIIMLAAFIAASAIDLQLWVIPISICWFVTVVGFIVSAIGVLVIDPGVISSYKLLPVASAPTAALALGAAGGLGISVLLLKIGLIKRSYESENLELDKIIEKLESANGQPQIDSDENLNHRAEILKEVVFLIPVILCSLACLWITSKVSPIRSSWIDFSQKPIIAGLMGSLFGYFVGCGIVWATRILGTLGFGKEAMGLGDVHLMGAAGAVIGPLFVVVAFFIAPFFGLGWAAIQMFFKKTRQIPYGPFLSLAVFTVIILHDWFLKYLEVFYYR